MKAIFKLNHETKLLLILTVESLLDHSEHYNCNMQTNPRGRLQRFKYGNQQRVEVREGAGSVMSNGQQPPITIVEAFRC